MKSKQDDSNKKDIAWLFVVQAVEVSYMSGACDVDRMEGRCYESIHGTFGMCGRGKGIECIV